MKKPFQQQMPERAARRIRAIAVDIGKDYNDCGWGWIAEAGRVLDVPYTTMHAICTKPHKSVGILTIERICKKVGCSASDLMGK